MRDNNFILTYSRDSDMYTATYYIAILYFVGLISRAPVTVYRSRVIGFGPIPPPTHAEMSRRDGDVIRYIKKCFQEGLHAAYTMRDALRRHDII